MHESVGFASNGIFVWAVVVPSSVKKRVVMNTHPECFTARER
jgi:hypothetical protein